MFKITHRFATLTLFVILILSSACRTEESEFINPDDDETLEPDSVIADLLFRVATNDGSIDNILDRANCFTLKYPVSLTANSISLTVASEMELNDVEAIFDRYDDDADVLALDYPIAIIKDDFEEVEISNDSELTAMASTCNGENIIDDDIECIDFVYPFSASRFNTNNEFLGTETFTNDKELYSFIENITASDIINLDFPITTKRFDDSEIEINSLMELEMVIEDNVNACNEDDDYDYNDDDCNDCTVQQLTELLTSCPTWTVENLERDTNNTEDYYVAYTFQFFTNGTIESKYGIWTYYGTWTANGTGNNIIVEIDIPELPDCNNSWRLHEIDLSNEATECDLNFSSDKLRYISNCDADNIDDSGLVNTITDGTWYVSNYFNDTDLTSMLSDYTFSFSTNNNWIAVNSPLGNFGGYWLTLKGDETDLELNMNFNENSFPIEYLVEDWDVISSTADKIMLKDISSGDGTEDVLTLEKL